MVKIVYGVFEHKVQYNSAYLCEILVVETTTSCMQEKSETNIFGDSYGYLKVGFLW